MSKGIQAIRGMNDILPAQTPVWQQVEASAAELLAAYGYREIRLPLLERTELFRRSIGDQTDIVMKEMYTFDDRNGESLTLRPEATASLIRAGLSNGLIYNQRQRLWCSGPMFRYEKPQKGRYRQFHQINVEAIGFDGPDVDAELILLSARLWRRLGINDLALKINSLGTPASRAVYRDRLVEYFSLHREQLDEDSLRRLESNPMRILDSKNPDLKDLIAAAPVITASLDEGSARHFAGLCRYLDQAGIAYEIDPRLVRGLDYYTRTVFEWVTDQLGAQDAVCSGGRYDGLVEQLGGKATPAVGWALGVERLVALVEQSGNASAAPVPHVYVAMVGDEAEYFGQQIAERLRDAMPGIRIECNAGGGSFKAQLKRADASGATLALIIGGEECAAKTATVKALRDDSEQITIGVDELENRLGQMLGDTLLTRG